MRAKRVKTVTIRVKKGLSMVYGVRGCMYIPLLRLSLEIHISCRTIVHQAHSVYRSTLGIEKIVREDRKR